MHGVVYCLPTTVQEAGLSRIQQPTYQCMPIEAVSFLGLAPYPPRDFGLDSSSAGGAAPVGVLCRANIRLIGRMWCEAQSIPQKWFGLHRIRVSRVTRHTQ